MIEVSGNLAFSTTTSSRFGKLKAIYSPLWLCFLLAILSRVWIIVHTYGVMAAVLLAGGPSTAASLPGAPPHPYFFPPHFWRPAVSFAALLFLVLCPAVSAMPL